MARWWDRITGLWNRLARTPSQERPASGDHTGPLDSPDAGPPYWEPALENIFESNSPTDILGDDEAHGRDLFYQGFVNPGLSPDERQEARESFFDWMFEWGLDPDEFTWDDWREWYEEAS